MLKDSLQNSFDQQINEQLRAQILAKDIQIVHLKEAYDYLQSQLDALKRMIFGSKSERFIDPDSKQPSLLDEQDFTNVDATGAKIPEELIQVAPHSRKKKVNPHKSLPRRKVIITLTEAEMLCECGACKDVIRTEIKEIINYVPAVFELIEQHRQVAACPKCKEGIVTAPAPLQILPKVGVSESFLSYLVTSKFEDRQPLYHLETKMYSYGVDCSRQNMARWLIDLVEPLRPIYNLLKDNIIEYDVASCDATSLQVLKEPERSAQIKSDVYCMLGGPPDKSVVLYDYNAKKHKEFVTNWFTDYRGYLHVDADNCFDLVATTGAVLSCCNAHARRKFEPIAKATKGQGVAKQALLYYSKLYKVERESKSKELNHEQRHALRQEKSKPIMEEFYIWLEKIQPTVLPQSTLGKAVAYAMNHRIELMRYLDDGRLEIDNNHTERMIKPLVIARKNFMFCNSVAGANAVCMHFGLIQTAKLHGLDPYEYYVILLTNIPYCKTVEDYELLLPWNVKAKANKTIDN
jgi:transposase